MTTERLEQTMTAAFAAARHRPAPPLQELLAQQDEWDRQDRQARHAGEAEMRVRYLEALGFAADNWRPSWGRLPADYRADLQEYCEDLRGRVQERHGLYLGAAIGAGKSCALALLALRARQLSLSCSYVLAGWALVEACAEESQPYSGCDVLILDDIDYVSTAGYEGEERSWDTIGRYLYRRYTGGGAVCIASNLPYAELSAKPGLERVASRWEERLPVRWRMETDAADQRRQQTTE